MRLRWLAIAVCSGLASLGTSPWAQERHDEQRHEEQGKPSHPPPKTNTRQAPPPYKSHPPGEHPHGPVVRPHPVRVMSPRLVVRGHAEWAHWNHPEFARPVYYWEWSAIRSVTCIAEDSYGDQYPVTEVVTPGFNLAGMTAVEDAALDRCYAESGQDPTCYLATCSHF
ncbi:MAG TPA: hypothetical protein VMK42_06010 [Anaeromyxobacteraceae bacterium]|nr:hypothetical protein [Anaeromyxobacteraceae bacterium]